MKRNVINIGLSLLGIGLIAYVYVTYGATNILGIEVIHWCELLVTILLGIVLPYVFFGKQAKEQTSKDRLRKKTFDKKTITLIIRLLAIIQIWYLVTSYFWSPDLEHAFLSSPIGRILSTGIKGIAIGIYIWYVRIVVLSGINYVYHTLLPRVRKTVSTKDDQLLDYAYSIAKFFINPILIIVWIIYVFGVNATIAIYSAGVGTVFLAAIAFAFRSIFNDYLAGIWLHIEDQIRVGDWITINGKKGKIEVIRPRYTILKTLSGSNEVIPNGMMVEHNFTNHIKDHYLGIYGEFSLPITTEEKVAEDLTKDLISFIKNHTKPVADTEIDQKDPRIIVKLRGVTDDTILYSFEFIVKADEFNPTEECHSDKFYKDQARYNEVREKVLYHIVALQKKYKIISHAA